MKLQAIEGTVLRGTPRYAIGDHAFVFEPYDRIGDAQSSRYGKTTSLALDTLQLEVSTKGRRLLWLWGYSPMTAWEATHLTEPAAADGIIQVLDVDLLPGVSIRVSDGRVGKAFDETSGWFRATVTAVPHGRAIRIATDTIVFIDEGKLNAVFVRPVNWKDLTMGKKGAG